MTNHFLILNSDKTEIFLVPFHPAFVMTSQTPLTRCACPCPWSHFYLTWMLTSILVCLILPAQRF